jgi:hypothetical protein
VTLAVCRALTPIPVPDRGHRLDARLAFLPSCGHPRCNVSQRSPSIHDTEEVMTMSERPRSDPEQSLAQLGLEEVEQRLEVSPLLLAADVCGLEREGFSCCCKLPPEPEEDEAEDEGGG